MKFAHTRPQAFTPGYLDAGSSGVIGHPHLVCINTAEGDMDGPSCNGFLLRLDLMTA